MTEPNYGPDYERFWDRLPQVYRDRDAENTWQLKRWLAGVGSQMQDLFSLIQRFSYVAPNDRGLRYHTDQPSGENLTSTWADLSRSPDDDGIWQHSTSGGMDYYQLLHQSDGAFIEYTPYLQGGDYSLSMTYPKAATNGVFELFINGNQVLTYVETATGTGNDTMQQYNFTVTRGYVNIRFKFVIADQADNTKLINVGPVNIINLNGGYSNDTSDLVNPASADPEWLPWLGQLVGVTVDQGLSVQDQRDLITDATTGFQAGTKEAIANAVRPILTGTKYCRVIDHSTDASGGIGAGTMWDLLIITRTSETPSGFDIPGYVKAKGAKPAGVSLHQRTFSASWDTILASYPHWNDWQAHSWSQLEEAGFV